MPAAILRDAFNRADGAVGNADTGQAWTTTGTTAISSNTLAVPGSSSTAQIDPGQQNVHIRFAMADWGSTSDGWHFQFAYVDANNYAMIQDYFGYRLLFVVGGLVTYNALLLGGSAQVGDAFDIEVAAGAVTVNIASTAGNGANPAVTIPSALVGTLIRFTAPTAAVTPKFDNLVVWSAPLPHPSTWILSSTGTAGGDGTVTAPFDWKTAAIASSLIGPGDQLQVRIDGDYGHTTNTSAVVATIAGSQSLPILIRPYPADVTGPQSWPKIRLQWLPNTAEPTVPGWCWFHDLEFANDDPGRGQIQNAGQGIGGITLHRSGEQLIDMLVHEFNGGGCSMWSQAWYSKVINSFVYNNGALDISNGQNSGQGSYTENNGETQHQFIDCYMANNFFQALQIYSAGGAQIKNYLIQGGLYMNSIAIGGQHTRTLTENINVDQVLSFAPGIAASIGFGYISLNNTYGSLTNSVLVNDDPAGGGGQAVIVQYFQTFNASGNVIMSTAGSGNRAIIVAQDDTQVKMVGDWNHNTYIGQGAKIFEFELNHNGAGIGGGNYTTLDAWRQATGLAENGSTLTIGPPTAQYVRVRRATRRPVGVNCSRAFVQVADWSGATTITADMTNVLLVGETYKIYHVFDYIQRNAAVATGTYNGGTITWNQSAPAPPPELINGVGCAVYPPLITPAMGRPGAYIIVVTATPNQATVNGTQATFTAAAFSTAGISKSGTYAVVHEFDQIPQEHASGYNVLNYQGGSVTVDVSKYWPDAIGPFRLLMLTPGNPNLVNPPSPPVAHRSQTYGGMRLRHAS